MITTDLNKKTPAQAVTLAGGRDRNLLERPDMHEFTRHQPTTVTP